VWELLTKLFIQLPGSKRWWHKRPFDQYLLNWMYTRSPMALQNLVRHLKFNVKRRQLRCYWLITMRLLELGNMKNWVNLSRCRQGESICHSSNLSFTLERAKESECQLLTGTPGNRSLRIWLQLQEHPITNIK
jgi:hypothetical protein